LSIAHGPILFIDISGKRAMLSCGTIAARNITPFTITAMRPV
jgi:hypothetical protein